MVEETLIEDVIPSQFSKVLAQLWAWLLMAAIFLQVVYLMGGIETAPIHQYYVIALLIIGLLLLLYMIAIQLQHTETTQPMNNDFYLTKLQKHHCFILIISGIGISIYNILHFELLFPTLVLEYGACIEAATCQVFHLLCFLFVCMQIVLFYCISGSTVPTNAIYQALFIFLMVLNLICYTTIISGELKNLQVIYSNSTNRSDFNFYTEELQDISDLCSGKFSECFTPEIKVSDSLIPEIRENLHPLQMLFVPFGIQYFFIAAYIMFTICWRLSHPVQPRQLDHPDVMFSFKRLMQAIKRCCRCHSENDQEQEPLLTQNYRISQLIPFFKIFKSPSGIIIGCVLASIVTSLNIYFDHMLSSKIKQSTNNYYILFISTRVLNESAIVISTIIAFNSLRSMTKYVCIIHNKDLSVKGDQAFTVFTLCGTILENFLGFYSLFLANNVISQSLLILFGMDYIVGFINASSQTHFILSGLDLKVIRQNEFSNEEQANKQKSAKSLQQATIVSAILNMCMAGVYLYETQQSYFNIVKEVAYGHGQIWQSVQLVINPLSIFYRFFCSVCMFKIAIEFSNVFPDTDDNLPIIWHTVNIEGQNLISSSVTSSQSNYFDDDPNMNQREECYGIKASAYLPKMSESRNNDTVIKAIYD